MNAAAAGPPPLIVIDPEDSVGVATATLRAGEVARAADGRECVVLDTVRRGHKIALRDHSAGALVIKYGGPIGRATAEIRRGEHVHSHNLSTIRGRRDDPGRGSAAGG